MLADKTVDNIPHGPPQTRSEENHTNIEAAQGKRSMYCDTVQLRSHLK